MEAWYFGGAMIRNNTPRRTHTSTLSAAIRHCRRAMANSLKRSIGGSDDECCWGPLGKVSRIMSDSYPREGAYLNPLESANQKGFL